MTPRTPAGDRLPQEAALRARLYELIHRGTPGDVEFYVDLCRGAHSVLELACGAGRVLGPVAQVCDHATGVDVSPAMLARAAARLRALPSGRARLIEADLARPLPFDVDLGGPFDIAIFPYNGLFALPDLPGIRQCLTTARAHLQPHGLLALDVYIPDLSEATPPPAGAPFEHLMTIVDGASGEASSDTPYGAVGTVDVFERLVPLPGAQRFGMEFRYDIHAPPSAQPQPGAPLVFQRLYELLSHRWLYPDQLTTLLREAGFTVEHRWGDFSRGPLTPDSEQLVVLARAI